MKRFYFERELNEAFESMSEIFTSYEFSKSLKRKGVPSSKIKGTAARYLKKHCSRVSHLTWKKGNRRHNITITFDDITESSISHLKSLGYKILKPQTQYIEI